MRFKFLVLLLANVILASSHPRRSAKADENPADRIHVAIGVVQKSAPNVEPFGEG